MSIKRGKSAVLAGIVVLALAAFLALRLAYDPAQKQLAAIRAARLPASAAELDAWYLPVAARENRALAILEAAISYVPPAARADPNSARLGSLDAGSELSPKMIEAIEAHLAANRETIDLVHEAGQLKESRYPIDLSRGAGTLLPHLAQIRSLVSLLRVESAQCSRLGKAQEAVRALETAFAVADSLRDEPILVSEMVRIQCVALAVNALERLVNEHQLSDKQLARLSEKVVEAERTGHQAYRRALIGERALSIELFHMSFREINALSSGASSDAAMALGPLGFQVYRAIGAQKRDQALYLRLMDRLIQAAECGFPEVVEKTEAVDRELMAIFSRPASRFMAITRQNIVPLTGSALKEANIAARLRCARVALAIERFRLERGGALPESLRELAPRYLAEIPNDPFDGSSLVFERLPAKGYRIAAPFESPSRKNLAKHSEDAPFSVAR